MLSCDKKSDQKLIFNNHMGHIFLWMWCRCPGGWTEPFLSPIMLSLFYPAFTFQHLHVLAVFLQLSFLLLFPCQQSTDFPHISPSCLTVMCSTYQLVFWLNGSVHVKISLALNLRECCLVSLLFVLLMYLNNKRLTWRKDQPFPTPAMFIVAFRLLCWYEFWFSKCRKLCSCLSTENNYSNFAICSDACLQTFWIKDATGACKASISLISVWSWGEFAETSTPGNICNHLKCFPLVKIPSFCELIVWKCSLSAYT